MNDNNPFEDFINGLDLPEPDGSQSIPLPVDDADPRAARFVARTQALINDQLMQVTSLGVREWSSALSGIQLLIRDEILRSIKPLPGSLTKMSKEEVASNAGYTLITLAMLIYDRVMAQITSDQDDDE